MLFTIVGEDVRDSLPLRKLHRPAHLNRLKALNEQGRLVVAGPNPVSDIVDASTQGFTGSLIVAEFSSLEAAQEWADADPYLTNGVYRSVTVKPFIQVLPD